MVDLGIKYLKVEPIAGILQEVTIRVSKEVLPLIEESMDDIRAIPHGFKHPFLSVIMGLLKLCGWTWES